MYMYIMYFDDVNIIKAPLGHWYAGQLSTTLCLDKYCMKTLKDILKNCSQLASSPDILYNFNYLGKQDQFCCLPYTVLYK